MDIDFKSLSSEEIQTIIDSGKKELKSREKKTSKVVFQCCDITSIKKITDMTSFDPPNSGSGGNYRGRHNLFSLQSQHNKNTNSAITGLRDLVAYVQVWNLEQYRVLKYQLVYIGKNATYHYWHTGGDSFYGSGDVVNSADNAPQLSFYN